MKTFCWGGRFLLAYFYAPGIMRCRHKSVYDWTMKWTMKSFLAALLIILFPASAFANLRNQMSQQERPCDYIFKGVVEDFDIFSGPYDTEWCVKDGVVTVKFRGGSFLGRIDARNFSMGRIGSVGKGDAFIGG